jgi:hypothetical protein
MTGAEYRLLSFLSMTHSRLPPSDMHNIASLLLPLDRNECQPKSGNQNSKIKIFLMEQFQNWAHG